MQHLQNNANKITGEASWEKVFLRFMAYIRCIAAFLETALGITHADDQMLEIYQVIGQMAPKCNSPSVALPHSDGYSKLRAPNE